jgi:hypothetical protein
LLARIAEWDTGSSAGEMPEHSDDQSHDSSSSPNEYYGSRVDELRLERQGLRHELNESFASLDEDARSPTRTARRLQRIRELEARIEAVDSELHTLREQAVDTESEDDPASTDGDARTHVSMSPGEYDDSATGDVSQDDAHSRHSGGAAAHGGTPSQVHLRTVLNRLLAGARLQMRKVSSHDHDVLEGDSEKVTKAAAKPAMPGVLLRRNIPHRHSVMGAARKTPQVIPARPLEDRLTSELCDQALPRAHVSAEERIRMLSKERRELLRPCRTLISEHRHNAAAAAKEKSERDYDQEVRLAQLAEEAHRERVLAEKRFSAQSRREVDALRREARQASVRLVGYQRDLIDARRKRMVQKRSAEELVSACAMVMRVRLATYKT